jgi:hypothetical protein
MGFKSDDNPIVNSGQDFLFKIRACSAKPNIPVFQYSIIPKNLITPQYHNIMPDLGIAIK